MMAKKGFRRVNDHMAATDGFKHRRARQDFLETKLMETL